MAGAREVWVTICEAAAGLATADDFLRGRAVSVEEIIGAEACVKPTDETTGAEVCVDGFGAGVAQTNELERADRVAMVPASDIFVGQREASVKAMQSRAALSLLVLFEKFRQWP